MTFAQSRRPSRGGGSSKADSVNIVIRATNEADKVFEGAKVAVLETAKAADLLRSQFTGVGVAALSSTGAIISKLAEVNQIILSIRGVLTSEIGRSVISSIEQQANEAVTQIASLSDLATSLSAATTPFLQTLFLGDRPDQVAQRTQALAETISKTLVGGMRSSLEGQFGQILGFLPEEIRSRVNLGDALSSALGFGLDEFIKSKLPAGVDQMTGGLAAGVVRGFAVPQEVNALVEGNTFDALEKLIAQKVQQGLEDAYQNFDAITLGAGGDLNKAGELVADYVVQGLKPSDLVSEALSTTLDNLGQQLGSPAKEIIEDLRPRFEEGLVNVVRELDEPLTKQVGELIQKAVTGQGGGAFKPIREQFLAAISGLDETSGGLLGSIGARLGTRLGVAFSSGFLGRATAGISQALNGIDARIRATIDLVSSVPERISGPLGTVAAGAGAIAGFDEPLTVFGGIQSAVFGFAEGVFEATQQLAFFQAGMSALQQFVVGGPFDLLIGQNMRLQEQLLATQSSLVATNQILDSTGRRIMDPTQAIQALGPAINSAIEYIRKGSLELVGVTSNELIESFQIISGQIGQLGISLQQAADLTLSMAASLGTLGIPLFQARQEISSLLQGTIDMNSVLAKSLGITNQQVALWKSQGRIFEELNKRLEAFRAGNALAARTIGGITSNIREIFDEIGRQAGAPLLEPIVDRLEGFYEFLQSRQDEFAESISRLIGMVFDAGEQALDALVSLYQTTEKLLGQIPEYLITSLTNAIIAFANAIKATIPIITPAVNVLATLAERALALGGGFLQIAVQAIVLQKAVSILGGSFKVLANTLDPLGQVLFFLVGRNNSLINTFATLSKQIGFGAAGFLMLGKNAASLPMIASELAKRFGAFGGILGNFLPQIATVGITLVGVAKNSKPLEQVMVSLTKQFPGVISALAAFVAQSNFAGGAFRVLAPEIQKVAQTVNTYASNIDNATFFNELFVKSAKAAGVAARAAAMSFGLITAGAFAALFVFDKFILNNEGLLKTLEALWNTLTTVGKAIYDFLTNPVVAATGVVVGLGVAINAGLLPAIAKITTAFTGKATAAIAAWSSQGIAGLTAFSDAIRRVQVDFTGLFESPARQARAQVAEMQQALTQQLDAFNQAIAQRMKIPGQEAQIAQMITERQNLVNALAELNQQMVTPTTQERVKSLGANFAELGTTVQTRATASLVQFKGVSQRLGGDTLIRLGQALGDLGFEQLAIDAASAGNAMFETGRNTLESEAAQRGLLTAIDASSVSIEGFRGRLAAAATTMRAGVVTAINTVKGALATLWATAGPALLLVGAIAAVTEAVGIFSRQQESATKVTRGFADAIEEASLKAGKFEVILRSAAKSGADYAQKRLKELEGEASWLAKAADLIPLIFLTLGPGGTARREARQRLKAEREDIDQLLKDTAQFRDRIRSNYGTITKDEQELANLQNRLAEARAKKDDAEVTKIQARIDILKQAGKARMEEIDAAIAYLERQRPLNAEQEQALARRLEQLRAIKRTIEEIPNTKITPPDLPRLGAVYEQLATKAKQAVDFIRRGVGTQDQFKQKAEELLAVTEQQVSLGLITREQARERLRLLASNVRAEVDIQTKAREQIAATYTQETESRGREYQRQQQLIEEIAADEEISTAEREAQITAIKRQELEERLENARRAAREELEIARDNLRAQQDGFDASLREVQGRIAAAQRSGNTTEEQKARQQQAAILAEREAAVAAHNRAVERLNRNAAQEEQSIFTEMAQNEGQDRRRMREEMVRDYEEAQTQLEGAKAQGLLGERDFADRSIQITRQRLDLEAQLIEEQRSRLSEDDKEGQEALDTQLAEVNKRRAQAEQQYQQQVIEIQDRARQKLLDAATEAQTQAEIEIQRLVNQGVIRRDEAEIRKLKATDDRVREELRLEEEKLKQLQVMDALTDPEAEERRQQQIRQSRIRTGQLTLQIAENEYRRQEAIRQRQAKLLDDEILKRQNRDRTTLFALEKEQRNLDRISRTYELQNKILETRKGFLEASSGLLETQLRVLGETAQSDRQRKDIAFVTANIQLRTLNQRQQAELEITQLNQEQQRIALEREQIENRIARIRNQAEQFTALAEAAKTEADPEATAAQREAARLGVVASVLEGQALAQQGAELQRQGMVQDRIFQSEISSLLMRQQGDRLTAQMGVMQADPNRGRSNRGRRAMRENLLQGLGFRNMGELGQASRAIGDQFYSNMFPGRFQPALAGGPGLPMGVPAPQIALPGLSGLSGNPAAGLAQFAQSAPELMQTLRGIQENLGALMGLDIKQDIQINQSFTGEEVRDGRFRQKVRAEVIDQTYEVAQKLQQRQRAIAGRR